MTIETYFAYAVALGVFAASPGPGVFATIAHAMTRGAAPAFALLTGLITADVIYLAAAAYGLGVAAKQMGDFFVVFRIIGAGYLIWLGWKSWTQQYTIDPDNPLPRKRRSFLGGFAISLSNPKVMVFYLAFLPTFIDLKQIGHTDVAVFAVLTALISYIVLGVYIFGARSLATTFEKPSIRRRFDRAAGAMLIGAGVAVAARN